MIREAAAMIIVSRKSRANGQGDLFLLLLIGFI